jgi:hypothetical protein
VAEVPSNPSCGHRRTTSGSFDYPSKGSGPPVCDRRHQSTSCMIRTRPILLQTAVASIHREFRSRLDFRSVHEGSVPRSMHLPTSTAFDHERLQRGQSALAVEIPQSTAAGTHTPSPLESLQSFSKLSLGSSPVPSQCALYPHTGKVLWASEA